MSVFTLSNAGLRPMSAFVVIGAVVLAVAGRVCFLTKASLGAQPALAQEKHGLPPTYAISDRDGGMLARFVPRFDLELSPRSMWQAHTPDRMAQQLSEALGGHPHPDELLELLLPDAVDGVITVDAWALSARQANALGQWIAGGAEGDEPAIPGLWLERDAEVESTWRLVWEPARVLSSEARAARGYSSAWTFGRYLAGGIATALRSPDKEEPRGSEARDSMRAEVWSALIPSAWTRPLIGLPGSRIAVVRALLEREGVSPWQMRIAFGRDRVYPAGEHELYGSWGYLDEKQTSPVPREGLEYLCDQLLSRPEWSGILDDSQAVYRWLSDRTVRGHRERGYLSYDRAAAPPIVESTLDLGLQGFVSRALAELRVEHMPALAMAIVVDVDSGDVLAVDSSEEYPIQPFAPVYHLFTTGSTMKILTMASAIEERVVDPGEMINVGHGAYRIVHDGRPTGRVIHEAEGAGEGLIMVRDAFATSTNAGMVQVGLRMSAEAFRGYLSAAGYGKHPGAGLGSERAGYLKQLPWRYEQTHASVCFGHEISSTLWQHAAGIATVLRGGEFRPLRLVRAVEQAHRRFELPTEPGQRVFSDATAREVQDLMRYGAAVGTGEDVREELLATTAEYLGADRAEAERFLDVGSKTGTAEKVGGEVCVHLELPLRSKDPGITMDELRRYEKPHPRSCYTSSIVLFGERADEGRRLMVLVVAEEPRGKQKYGSKVSGPTAAAILAEALGITRNGRTPRREIVQGFNASSAIQRNLEVEPWRMEAHRW